jgi:PPOX class probable F420-dependent enzyme
VSSRRLLFPAVRAFDMDDATRRSLRETVADAPLSAHLATSVDDRPHVVPVWYTYAERDGEGVFSVLTGGRKLRNLRENPRVALSVEQASGGTAAWRVVVFGTAQEVTDETAIQNARDAVFEKYYGPDYEAADAEEGGALVEVTVGSADVERY